MLRGAFEDFSVLRSAASLARIFLARAAERAAPVLDIVLTLVRGESVTIDHEEFSTPATENVLEFSFG